MDWKQYNIHPDTASKNIKMCEYPMFPLRENDEPIEYTDFNGDKHTYTSNTTHTLMVQAHMGLGKTQALIRNLGKYQEKYGEDFSMIVISYRILLCNEYLRTFNTEKINLGLRNYRELKSQNNYKKDDWSRVVVCLDSLVYALRARDSGFVSDVIFPYDIVILEELDSLLSYSQSIKKDRKCIQKALTYFLKEAKVVVAMDAFLKNERCEMFINLTRPPDDVKLCIECPYVRPTNKKMIVYEEFIDAFRLCNINEKHYGKTKFIIDLMNSLKKGKRVCVVSMSKNFLTFIKSLLENDMEWEEGTQFMFYTSNTAMATKEEDSKDLVKAWELHNLVGWSPTITAGVNYQIDFKDWDNPTQEEMSKVFDEMYIYCLVGIEETCSVYDLFQMTGRIRQLKDPDTTYKDHNITALLLTSTVDIYTNLGVINSIDDVEQVVMDATDELTKWLDKEGGVLGEGNEAREEKKEILRTKNQRNNVWWMLYAHNIVRQYDSLKTWKYKFMQTFKKLQWEPEVVGVKATENLITSQETLKEKKKKMDKQQKDEYMEAPYLTKEEHSQLCKVEKKNGIPVGPKRDAWQKYWDLNICAQMPMRHIALSLLRAQFNGKIRKEAVGDILRAIHLESKTTLVKEILIRYRSWKCFRVNDEFHFEKFRKRGLEKRKDEQDEFAEWQEALKMSFTNAHIHGQRVMEILFGQNYVSSSLDEKGYEVITRDDLEKKLPQFVNYFRENKEEFKKKPFSVQEKNYKPTNLLKYFLKIMIGIEVYPSYQILGLKRDPHNWEDEDNRHHFYLDKTIPKQGKIKEYILVPIYNRLTANYGRRFLLRLPLQQEHE
ncbi:MAG TPA: hypothetical protein DHV22_15000, partial [Xanthomarina gelatinilytica]|nr:hypothetical protein [Xanthomarina gelatinilytica]